MKLYGMKMPEVKPENIRAIITIARDIHQDEVNRRTRNTELQRWDKYWTDAYNMILKEVKL